MPASAEGIAMTDFHDDSPIERPDSDKLEHGVFAKALADCILGIKKPQGGVIAIHGPWGSGKSSVINLVLYELDGSRDRPAIIKFNSWCYRSEDGIVSGFFQELYSGLKSEINDSSINLESVLKLGNRLSKAAKFVSPVLDMAAVPGVGAIASASNEFFEKSLAENQTIDSLQRRVNKELSATDKRFLVVIDDVDRLSPEEAISLFRVIKSVGRLKNITYLLSYDRMITEKVILDRYPAEGSHYLEKIIQASFDLPNPRPATLSKIIEPRFKKIFKGTLSGRFQFSDDRIREIVLPEIRTPRDVHRLANILSVTFPAVENDVDIGDFISLETLRLFHPNIYNEIRSNKSILTSSGLRSSKEGQVIVDRIREICKESNSDISRIINALKNLFPSLNSDSKSTLRNRERANQEQRLCSPLHFDTYFRFSVSGDIVSNAEFQNFVKNASNRSFVESKLDRSKEGAYDHTKISFLFDKISYNTSALESSDIGPFLTTLYDISSNLYLANRRRIFDVCKKILLDRFEDINPADIILAICRCAPLDLKLQLCSWVCTDYTTVRTGDGEEKDLVSAKDIGEISEAALGSVRSSVYDDTIFEYANLLKILGDWRKLSPQENEVDETFNGVLDRSDKNVVMAAQNIHRTFSFYFDSERRRGILKDTIYDVMDGEHFANRLLEVIEADEIDDRSRYDVLAVYSLLNPQEEDDDDDETASF